MGKDLTGRLAGLTLALAPLAMVDGGLAGLVAERDAHLREHLR